MNQKHFILFTTYVMLSCVYAAILVVWTFVAFPKSHELTMGGRTCLIFLFMEALLFGAWRMASLLHAVKRLQSCRLGVLHVYI